MISKTRLLMLAATAGCLSACAHTDEMTADEHRAQAVHDQRLAEVEKSQYDPNAIARTPAPRGPEADIAPELREYNPTAAHLAEADRKMRESFGHLNAADKLERYEDVACANVSLAERTSCPLLAPHVASVEEGSRGVTLHLTQSAPAQRLASQLSCHLAFARANGFDRAPCPLFLKGVTITLRGSQLIDIFASDAKTASELRLEARRMFGQAVPVAQR